MRICSLRFLVAVLIVGLIVAFLHAGSKRHPPREIAGSPAREVGARGSSSTSASLQKIANSASLLSSIGVLASIAGLWFYVCDPLTSTEPFTTELSSDGLVLTVFNPDGEEVDRIVADAPITPKVLRPDSDDGDASLLLVGFHRSTEGGPEPRAGQLWIYEEEGLSWSGFWDGRELQRREFFDSNHACKAAEDDILGTEFGVEDFLIGDFDGQPGRREIAVLATERLERGKSCLIILDETGEQVGDVLLNHGRWHQLESISILISSGLLGEPPDERTAIVVSGWGFDGTDRAVTRPSKLAAPRVDDPAPATGPRPDSHWGVGLYVPHPTFPFWVWYIRSSRTKSAFSVESVSDDVLFIRPEGGGQTYAIGNIASSTPCLQSQDTAKLGLEVGRDIGSAPEEITSCSR